MANTWRRLATKTVVGGTINAIMDCIADALDDTTYYNGASRTPGSGQAWSATKETATVTVGLRLSPPSGAPSGLRAYVAGTLGAGPHANAMASPDTTTANVLFMTHGKFTSGFAGWDQADVFTFGAGGQEYGYERLVSPAALTVQAVMVLECQNAIAFWFETSTGTVYGGWLGCGGKGPTTTGNAIGVVVESDGLVYGQHTTGTSTAFAQDTFVTGGGSTQTNNIISHSGSAAAAHCGSLAPGAATLRRTIYASRPCSPNTVSALKDAAGSPVFSEIPMYDGTSGPTRYILDGIKWGPRGKHREVWAVGGVDVAYYVGYSASTDGDTLAFMY